MAEECYIKLLEAYLAIQPSSNKLFTCLILDHPNAQSCDPQIALSNILKNVPDLKKVVKSISYPCNIVKVYDANGIKGRIIIDHIDTTLRMDIIRNVPGFPLADKGKCTAPNCNNRKEFCCSRCMKCKPCNNNLPAQQQCVVYKLATGADVEKKLRNLFSHLTLKYLDGFLHGQHFFNDFPNIGTWNDLRDTYKHVLNVMFQYIKPNNFNTTRVPTLRKDKIDEELKKLDDIFDLNKKVATDQNTLTNIAKQLNDNHQNLKDEMQENFKKLTVKMQNEFENVTCKTKVYCANKSK